MMTLIGGDLGYFVERFPRRWQHSLHSGTPLSPGQSSLVNLVIAGSQTASTVPSNTARRTNSGPRVWLILGSGVSSETYGTRRCQLCSLLSRAAHSQFGVIHSSSTGCALGRTHASMRISRSAAARQRGPRLQSLMERVGCAPPADLAGAVLAGHRASATSNQMVFPSSGCRSTPHPVASNRRSSMPRPPDSSAARGQGGRGLVSRTCARTRSLSTVTVTWTIPGACRTALVTTSDTSRTTV